MLAEVVAKAKIEDDTLLQKKDQTFLVMLALKGT